MSCAETTKTIDLPFVLWTRVGRNNTSSIIFTIGANVPTWRAHWRHLANMIELSVSGGDAVLCQSLWPLVIILL